MDIDPETSGNSSQDPADPSAEEAAGTSATAQNDEENGGEDAATKTRASGGRKRSSKKSAQANEEPSNEQTDEAKKDGPVALVDELGVQDLRDLIFGNRGRIFSAAGRTAPVAEFTEDYVVLHPPQKPFEEIGESEDIVIHVDDRGVLLNEIGQPRKIAGAKFGGAELWWLGERAPGTIKHYAGWFDKEGKVHKLLVDGEILTTEVVYRMRNKTHDGELSIFPDLTTE